MNKPLTTDILERIVDRKREVVEQGKLLVSQKSMEQMAQRAQSTRGFASRLIEQSVMSPAIIAEIKKASPSKGVICRQFDPVRIATHYQNGGACCLSVLTDEDFFQGSNEHLKQAREVCQLPILRKEFIIDPWQIYETRAIGADALLLICAILDDVQLHQFYTIAHDIGLDCLVEVHDQEEMERALGVHAQLIGINNRNLRTFETNLQTSISLTANVRPQRKTLFISESGIGHYQDICLLQKHHINAFLVGESLVCQADPSKALKQLLGQSLEK